MSISAKVVAHSRVHGSPDLITLQLRYPRFVHAEFMTHRVFSRNASSSRAIPIDRMIQDVIDDPAMPVAWGSNKPGMQAGEEIRNLVDCYPLENGEVYFDERDPEEAWLLARDYAVTAAKGFAKAGYHKQIVNRLLEPFSHISVVCTSTEWDNFFDLRCHPDADPTMRALAEAMRDAIAASTPVQMMSNGCHLPYVTDADDIRDWHKNNIDGPYSFVEVMALASAARCARVSYLNHDGTSPVVEKDLLLALRLLDSRHMSPFEHQGCPDLYQHHKHEWANFNGWIQYRKIIEAT